MHEVENLVEKLHFNADQAVVNAVFESKALSTDLLCLKAGQWLTPEAVDELDTLLVVLKGEGVFELGDEVAVLTSHTAILVPGGESVGIINESESGLTVLRVRSAVA